MRRSFLTVTILAAGTYFALAQPIRAQITTSVDSNGKLIFVNADSPKPHRGSTISPVPTPVP